MLINELCLEGVEFKELGKVCNIADNKRKPVESSLRNNRWNIKNK